MATRILSIDPSGTGTTGICLITNQTIEFKEFKDICWKNHYEFISSLVKLYKPDLLLFENTNFISNRSKDSLNLIRLLGAIECLKVKKAESINVTKVKELSKALFKESQAFAGKTKIENLQYLPGRGKGWMFKVKEQSTDSFGKTIRISIHQLEAFLVWYCWNKFLIGF